jgi:hypothetical protein
MTPSGIEPATFRFVAQYLNHCATAVPHYIYIYSALENGKSNKCDVLHVVIVTRRVRKTAKAHISFVMSVYTCICMYVNCLPVKRSGLALCVVV